MKAFPKLNEKQPSYQTGMDLRDWFAGLAMQGLVMESIAFQSFGVKKGVEYAYEIADAMMKARGQE